MNIASYNCGSTFRDLDMNNKKDPATAHASEASSHMSYVTDMRIGRHYNVVVVQLGIVRSTSSSLWFA